MARGTVKMVDVKEIRKKELTKLMSKYVNKEGSMDISAFRVDNPSKYALLAHYWGSINEAIESNGWKKLDHIMSAKRGYRDKRRLSLKDQLALYAMNELRKEKTYQAIGDMFSGFSRAAVRQLHMALKGKELPEPRKAVTKA